MRLVSASDAAGVVESGQSVYLHCAAATPSVVLQALVDRASELQDVSVVHLHTEGPGPHLAPEMAGHFRHRALFIGPNARAAVNEGRADYVPVFLSDVPRLFTSGALPLDAVFVNATPPDAHGFCSLGTSVEAMHAAVRAATTVVVQLNRSMPRTLGDSFIHVDDIDLGVEVDVPPYAHASPAIGDVEERIGAHVAALVPDRATLQLGIGAIPAATAMALMDKHDLGIHTEMFTDAVVDLVEAGVVNGSAKERNRGKIVTAFMMGSPRLYDFVNDNPMVEMRPVDFTNDTARHPLVQPDGLDQLRYRGRPDRPGGRRLDRSHGSTQASAARWTSSAARPSRPRAGRSSRCPSTAAGGTASRIVDALREGAGVVTTRAHVRTVVTEWGVAELFGKSLRERAEALIAHRPPPFPR